MLDHAHPTPRLPWVLPGQPRLRGETAIDRGLHTHMMLPLPANRHSGAAVAPYTPC